MIKLIVAVNEDFQIGNSNKNELLYHISNDLKNFRKKTLNSFVVMGKNTFLSLPKPFDNRTNVVISSKLKLDEKYCKEHDIIIESNISKVLNQYKETGHQEKELWIAGGAQLYAEGIKWCDEIELTMIHDKNHPDGNVYFPKQELRNFTESSREKFFDEKSGLYYSFINYIRKNES